MSEPYTEENNEEEGIFDVIGDYIKKVYNKIVETLTPILNTEKVSTKAFLNSIFISVLIAALVYLLIEIKLLHLENNLTATVAVVALVPTAYLWIVKERKKEKDIEQKERSILQKETEISFHKDEVHQSERNELNKLLVDAVNQFYNDAQFIAGAYSLEALMEAWVSLSKEEGNKDKNKEQNELKIIQIFSILMSRYEDKRTEKLYRSLVNKLVKRYSTEKDIFHRSYSLIYDWSNYELSGIDLSNSIIQSPIFWNANFKDASFENAILHHADFKGADLRGSHFEGAALVNVKFPKADLRYSYFWYCDLTQTEFANAKLEGADFRGATLTLEQFKVIRRLKNTKWEKIHNLEDLEKRLLEQTQKGLS